MKVEIRRVFNENFQVYGVRKVWRQLLREGYGRRNSGGVIRRRTHTSSGSKTAAPSRRTIMMLQWPWAKLE